MDQDDNELEVLEIIHHYVEVLDRYFGSVSYFPFLLGAWLYLNLVFIESKLMSTFSSGV